MGVDASLREVSFKSSLVCRVSVHVLKVGETPWTFFVISKTLRSLRSKLSMPLDMSP